MFKYRLPVAMTTALLVTAFGNARAQDKDAAHQPAPTAAATKPQQAPGAAPKAAEPPKTPAATDVVGSVFGKQITWADLSHSSLPVSSAKSLA
jgi:hypothetical protein